MINSADLDQLASPEANWSGSTLFAKTGHIWFQQDKVYPLKPQSQLQQTTIWFFFIFQRKKVLTFHVNHLPAKDKKKLRIKILEYLVQILLGNFNPL